MYCIDNSILKAKGPGVAWRHSKVESAMVPNTVKPSAKWNELVQGIDEGDGWLAVGGYYLPMEHKGIPVITHVDMSAIDNEHISQFYEHERKKHEKKHVQRSLDDFDESVHSWKHDAEESIGVKKLVWVANPKKRWGK